MLEGTLRNNLGQVVHTCVPLSPSSIVPAKGRWCCAAGEVTAGLAESNGSLPPGGWLTVTCGLTACTSGSAPGPTLGIEYGKPLPFYLLSCTVFEIWPSMGPKSVLLATPLVFNSIDGGFSWDDLRKIFRWCQWMAKVPNDTTITYQMP